MKWLIYAPPYFNASAGVRVLHRLCHLLRLIGEEAYISVPFKHPKWNTPQWQATIPEDMIVVYPEVVFGNPWCGLGAKRIVRYVLNDPGHLGGEKVYAPDEFVIYYMSRFHPTAKMATSDPEFSESRRVFISVIEPDIFYEDRSIPKTIDSGYIGKGFADFQQFAMPGWERLTQITRSYPSTREDLASLLRQTRTFYSYDDLTALSIEALICGAKVKIVKPNGELVPFEFDVSKYAEKYYSTASVEHLVAMVKKRWA